MDELIIKCKELGIDYMNKKTNKPFGKPSLLKKIASKSSCEIIQTTEEIKEYKNEIIWSASENKEYSDYETKLLNLIKKCHNILYSNGSIVGTDASNDIIKLLILRFINIIYNSEKGKKKIDELLIDLNEKIIEKFIPYIIDISKILVTSENNRSVNVENEVKIYIGSFLARILPNIFNMQDGFLNTRDEDINIKKIISEICEVIPISNTNISDYFSTQGGNIYEYFTNNYSKGNNTSKQLGQIFTPFNLIQAILQGCGFNDLIRTFTNPELYDPCCGSGGLLCITYKENKDYINSNCIYGCEVEKKTIKYALSSFIINTNELNTNILNCNSLSKNPYIFQNKKFDIIFTDAPFGIKNNYKDKKKEFEEFKDLNFEDSIIKFEDIYPLNISDGTVMFIELVIYLLNINGICAIILPDGKMMDTVTFYKLRKFIIDKCKILKIISVNNGAFGHTTSKTKVLILKRQDNIDNNNSKQIEFLEISKNCNEVKLIVIGDLNNKTLSFNLNEEKKEVIEYNEDIEVKKLGDICELIKGNKTKSSYGKKEGLYPLYYCSILGYLYLDIYDYDGYGIILNKTNGSGKCMIYLANGKYNVGETTIHFKGKSFELNKYIYYYLIFNLNLIENKFKGLNQKSISDNDLFELEIPIPSIERQTEIVEYFDEFFKDKDIKIVNNNSVNSFQLLLKKPIEFKNNLEKLYNIHNTNIELQKSIENIKNLSKITLDVINKNTECEIKNLGKIVYYKSGKRLPQGHLLQDNKTDYPYIRITDIDKNSISLKKLKYISKETNDIIRKYIITSDDIFITIAGTIGLVGIIPIELNGANLTENAISINIINNKEILQKYLLYIMHYICQDEIKEKTLGVAIPKLSIEKLMSINIPIPSIEKQEEIVKILDNNDMIIKNLEKMIEDNKELMKKIF